MNWRQLFRGTAVAYTAVPLLAFSATLLFIASLGLDWQVTLNRALGLVGLVCGAAGLAAAVFMLIASRRERALVRQVTEGARRMAKGELDQRLVSSPYHQPGDLTEEFNRMSEVIESKVRASEAERQQMAVAIDTMGDGVIVVDSETTVTLVSRAAEWLLGINAQTARGRPLAQVVRDPQVLNLVDAAAGTRQMQRAELELLYERRYLDVIATPVSGNDREDIVLTIRDVTRARQIETTRREFVSNVSHELRSPLASANAMVEILESGAIDDRETALDFLKRIRGDVTRMTSLVDELLELSSLESGQMPVHLGPVSVNDVLDEIVERFQLAASSDGIELLCNSEGNLPHVMGEQRRLEQVLTNLVENALRFTSDGGTITLSAKQEFGWVTVTVADTGVGIPREHLPHIFERFYKVERSRRDQGTGLGLAISKHLVQAQGGDISATSIEGEGSEFRVKLRRAT